MGDSDNGYRHVTQSVECSAGAVLPGMAACLFDVPVGKILPVPLSVEVPLRWHPVCFYCGGTRGFGCSSIDGSPDSGGGYAGEGVACGLSVAVDSYE